MDLLDLFIGFISFFNRIEVKEGRPAVVASNYLKTNIKKSKPKLPNNPRVGVVCIQIGQQHNSLISNSVVVVTVLNYKKWHMPEQSEAHCSNTG